MEDIMFQEEMQMEAPKKFHIFYLFPLLYVVSVYVLTAVFLFAGDYTEFIMPSVVIAYLIFSVLNIIAAVRFCKPENRLMLLNAAVLVKYALVPFFIVGGIFVAILFLMGLIPIPFMIFGTIMAIIGVAIGWVIVAFGSPYMIAYLRLAAKAGICSKATMLIGSILQFFFTLDVVTVMVLAWKEKKWKVLTGIMIVLIILAMLILLGSIFSAVTTTGGNK